MPNDALKPIMFIKLDEGFTTMIKALQQHFALEYNIFETPAGIVESAIFEMYTRMMMCGVSRKWIECEIRGFKNATNRIAYSK